MTDGNSSCHGLGPPIFEEMIHCRHKKHRRKWPGNPKGRSKFTDITYTFWFYVCLCLMRSWLVLHGWRQWQLPRTRAVVFEEMTRCRLQKHRRRWPRSIEILQLPKFMPTRSTKISQKHLFAVRTLPLWCYCALFFPTVTCNSYCSHLRKIIFCRPWPLQKIEIYILKNFFVNSTYRKTIDIFFKKKFLSIYFCYFSIFLILDIFSTSIFNSLDAKLISAKLL